MGKNTTQNNQKSVTKTVATPVTTENQQEEVMVATNEVVNESKVREEDIFDEVTSFLSSFASEIEYPIAQSLVEAFETSTGKEILELIELYSNAREKRIETGKKLSALINAGKAIILENQVIPVSSNLQITPEEDKRKNVEDSNLVVLNFMGAHFATLERDYRRLLNLYVSNSEVGRWLLKIKGMTPALAAGLLVYFDVDGKEYATQFISYAGLNSNNRPYLGRVGATRIFKQITHELKTTQVTDEFISRYAAATKWPVNILKRAAYDDKTKTWSVSKLIEAAAKYPYNVGLKNLLWKVGNAFINHAEDPESLYGSLFTERKNLEEQRNESGEYREQAEKAKRELGQSDPNYRDYAAGKLSHDHIVARASRWVQKVFVTHLFEEMYRVKHGHVPPRYYPLGRDPNHNREIRPEVEYFDVEDKVFVDAVPIEVEEVAAEKLVNL